MLRFCASPSVWKLQLVMLMFSGSVSQYWVSLHSGGPHFGPQSFVCDGNVTAGWEGSSNHHTSEKKQRRCRFTAQQNLLYHTGVRALGLCDSHRHAQMCWCTQTIDKLKVILDILYYIQINFKTFQSKLNQWALIYSCVRSFLISKTGKSVLRVLSYEVIFQVQCHIHWFCPFKCGFWVVFSA